MTRSTVLTVRMNRVERDALSLLAEANGVTDSEMVRQIVASVLRDPLAPVVIRRQATVWLEEQLRRPGAD